MHVGLLCIKDVQAFIILHSFTLTIHEITFIGIVLSVLFPSAIIDNQNHSQLFLVHYIVKF